VSFVPKRASCCVFLPDPQFLLVLPGQALGPVRPEAQRTDPPTRGSSSLHFHHPEGTPGAFRARTPLALASLTCSSNAFTAPSVFPRPSSIKLLGWNPSGFSVYANQLVFDDEPDRLERLARYLTRAPLGVDTVRTNDDGQVELGTPPQPSSADTVLQLNPLDWIHALCQQIPDRGQHLTRYYGAYANRTRKAVFQDETPENLPSGSESERERHSASSRSPASRASWARLLRKIFELDPLKCTPCGTEMKLIAVITEPHVVDRILAHLKATANPARPPPPCVSVQPSVLVL